MTTDIHVWLSDEEAESLKQIALREDRSITNLARLYIRRCLMVAGVDVVPENGKPKRGRPVGSGKKGKNDG
jgi:hypothetical protein